MNTTAPLTDVPHPALAEFDEDGFLADALLWTRGLAEQVALLDDIAPLTESHWKVIEHIRERFFRVGGVPAMRLVCRATGLNKTAIRQLFGDCRTVWRVAGLPNPGEEAKAHFL